MTIVLVTVASPANAHPVVEAGWPPGNRSGMIGGISGLCVQGQVVQEHAWHYVSTRATNCSNYVNATFQQYQSYFKQRLTSTTAEHCFDNGWHASASNVPVLHNHWPWDIGNWCNDGGVNVHVYVDSWQYAYTPAKGWAGGAWRPATKHCHCP